jgi:hypothetical protein
VSSSLGGGGGGGTSGAGGGPGGGGWTAAGSGLATSEELYDLKCELSMVGMQVEQLRDMVLRLESTVSTEFRALTARLEAVLGGGGVEGTGSPASAGGGGPASGGRGSVASGGAVTPRRPSTWAPGASALRRELTAVAAADSSLRRRSSSLELGGSGGSSSGAPSGACGAPLDALRGRKVTLWTGTWNVGAKDPFDGGLGERGEEEGGGLWNASSVRMGMRTWCTLFVH